jgi:circadian clock protein KaiC
MPAAESSPSEPVATGILGLDDVLLGGLPRGRLFLIDGDPGSGKTTLALQFLLAGMKAGEPCLYVTLSETESELRETARKHRWSLDGIEILEIVNTDGELDADTQYTMFHPSEVELTETTKKILAKVESSSPKRVVIDSLSELHLMAEHPLRYRRQVQTMKKFFARRQCMVLLINDRTGKHVDVHLHSITHGVIALEREVPEYGKLRRRLQVLKMRGQSFREGYHDYLIQQGGLIVFPRLVASEHRRPHAERTVASGVAALDALLGGGLAGGTSSLIMGAAGSGKSSVATLFARFAAASGERSSFFLFDESIATFLQRSTGLGMDVGPLIEKNLFAMRQIDPAELTSGEFTHLVRRAVEKDNSRLVVIDTLNGFLNAMPSERYLTLHLHELLTYLAQRGVTTLLVLTQHGIVGHQEVPLDVSYLADTVLLLRYFEAKGEVRQAISVIKKRTGIHERTIREIAFSNEGINVGEPLRDLQGVLTGVPTIVNS